MPPIGRSTINVYMLTSVVRYGVKRQSQKPHAPDHLATVRPTDRLTA